jgi:hypothetical protein
MMALAADGCERLGGAFPQTHNRRCPGSRLFKTGNDGLLDKACVLGSLKHERLAMRDRGLGHHARVGAY